MRVKFTIVPFLFLLSLIVVVPVVESSTSLFGLPLESKAIYAGVGAGCLLFGISCLKVIPTGDECLIERFGKYHRKLGAGWHIIAPIVEQASFYGTTREQILDIPPQQCYTLDNAPLKADAVVYMRILNMEQAKYNVVDIMNAVMNMCLTQLREEVGKLTLDETFSSRERINSALLKNLNVVCQPWGVMITHVEIQNLDPSRDILSAMELQMAAERKKRATILTSEGEKQKLINESEGKAAAVIANAKAYKERTVLEAEAEKERIQLQAQGMYNSISTMTAAIVKAKETVSKNIASGAILDHRDTKSSDPVDAVLQLLMLLKYMETQASFAGSGNNSTKVLMFPSKDTIPLTYEGLQSILK